MSNTPIAHLKSLSEEERARLSAVLSKKLWVRSIIFISAILISVAVVYFSNLSSSDLNSLDNLEVINLVFVVIIVVCARFLISEFQEFRKEISCSSKRVIRTKLAGRQGSKIVLGNKSFGREDILLDSSDFDTFGGGDAVILELSAKSNLIFAVKKAGKE